MPDLAQRSFIENIPSPEAVRDRLAQLTRERALLRALLRLAQRKQQAAERAQLQQRGGPDHAA
jgi:hypothetical protein